MSISKLLTNAFLTFAIAVTVVSGTTFAGNCDNNTNRNNCVFYARCNVPSLPGGLFTIANKRRIINSAVPVVGCVAIHDLGTTEGHLSVVTRIRTTVRNGQKIYSVTIQEGNYPLGKISTRFGNLSTLKIVGFYVP